MDSKTKEILQKFSTQKVELAAADKLNELKKELTDGVDRISKFSTDIREARNKGNLELNRLDAVKRLAEKRIATYSKAAKELGVDIPEIQKLEAIVSEYEQMKKAASKQING